METSSERVKDFDPRTYTTHELVTLVELIDKELLARELEEQQRLASIEDEYGY